MAYVLGYIAADGAITIGKHGNHYLDVISTDHELPDLVQNLLGSNHKISIRDGNPKWKPRYRLQIGSKELVEDLACIGIFQKKAKRLPMPNIPSQYFRHFVRGYFDGDGNVNFTIQKRKDRPSLGKHLHCVFTSCSKRFLQALMIRLMKEAGLQGGSLFFSQGAYRLAYAGHDSSLLYKFMYDKVRDIYLKRKQKYFTIAVHEFRGKFQ